MSFLPSANEVWGKVIFLHLSHILFTGGAVPGQVPPPGRYTLYLPGRYPLAGTATPGQVSPRQVHPPGRYTPYLPGRYPLAGTATPGQVSPRQVHPLGQVPPHSPKQVHPLGQVHPHPPGRHPLADTLPLPWQTLPCARHAGIRSTNGRYASHWNAFVFKVYICSVCKFISRGITKILRSKVLQC